MLLRDQRHDITASRGSQEKQFDKLLAPAISKNPDIYSIIGITAKRYKLFSIRGIRKIMFAGDGIKNLRPGHAKETCTEVAYRCHSVMKVTKFISGNTHYQLTIGVVMLKYSKGTPSLMKGLS